MRRYEMQSRCACTKYPSLARVRCWVVDGLSFRLEWCAVRRAFDDKRGRVCLNAHRQEHADAFNSAPPGKTAEPAAARPRPRPLRVIASSRFAMFNQLT